MKAPSHFSLNIRLGEHKKVTKELLRWLAESKNHSNSSSFNPNSINNLLRGLKFASTLFQISLIILIPKKASSKTLSWKKLKTSTMNKVMYQRGRLSINCSAASSRKFNNFFHTFTTHLGSYEMFIPPHKSPKGRK